MTRTVRAALVAALFVAVTAASLAAGELPLAFDVSPRILGADLGVGYTGLELLEGRGTTIWLWAGGGWESMPFFRASDGTMLAEYLDLGTGVINDMSATFPIPDADSHYQRAEAKWQLGIVQGFVAAPEDRPDLVVGFLYYRGRWDAHLEQGALPADTPTYGFPDQSGIFQNSLFAGAAYQGVVKNDHTVKSGIEAEASVEWGPSFLVSAPGGDADFLRLNATARFFLPLYDAAPDRDRNLFSVYAGDFVAVDWATGGAVPLNIRQSFGGQSPRTGLGGAVRGVDSGSLDGYFKAVNNLEVRVLGPALFLPDIVPGLVAYLDAGCFGSAGSPGPEAWGFVASTGAGVFVDLFGFAQLTLYVHYRLVGVNADGSAWSLPSFGTLDFGLEILDDGGVPRGASRAASPPTGCWSRAPPASSARPSRG